MAVRDDEYTLLSELVSLDSKSLPPPGSSPPPPPTPVWFGARELSGEANHSPKGLLETQSLVEQPGRDREDKGSSRQESHPWHPRV